MLVTDNGDEMCWRQFCYVGDGFGRFCHQHPLSFNISVGHQQPKERHQYRNSVTNIQKLSQRQSHQHPHVTIIYVALF